MISQWDKFQEVEEKIGMPFLMDIPVLGYLFSTVTISKEKIRVYLTLEAEVLDTAHPVNLSVGTLKQIKTTSRKGF